MDITISLNAKQWANVITAYTGKHGVLGAVDADKIAEWAKGELAACVAAAIPQEEALLAGWYDPSYIDALTEQAAKDAAASKVQGYIDLDAKLVASGITATADTTTAFAVVVSFAMDILAEDSARGMANKGALLMITNLGVGDRKREAVGATGFRATPDQCIAHLAQLSALLPAVA